MRKFFKSRKFAWSITLGTLIGVFIGIYSRWNIEQ